MNFLAPLFLAGAAAIVAPILFHLVRRATRERVPFSSLMFLRPTPPQLTSRRRLENLLLLLLRCLALGLLAFGFARPFLRHSLPINPTGTAAKRIVIMLDHSASMRRAGLWDLARERVEAAVKKASPIDQVAVFTFGRGVHSLVSFEEWGAAPVTERIALVTNRLAASVPGWESTQLDTALITAGEALADNAADKTPGPRKIVLVSDLQAGSQLNALQSYEWPKGVELEVEALKARLPTNAGVQWVAEAADTDRQSVPTVRIRVSNAAESTREQFQLGWTRGADNLYLGSPLNVYVPPGQSRVVALPLPTAAANVDRVLLRGDDEDFDNVAWVIPPEKTRMSAVYLGSENADDPRQPLFFLRRGLPDTPRFAVELKAYAPAAVLPPQEVQAAKLFVITERVSATTATALHEQALAGKTILFAPRDAGMATSLGAILGGPDIAVEEVKPANYAMFSEIDFQHPLFAAFADPRYSDFTKIHFWKYRRIRADAIPGGRVVAKFDSGDPAWIEVPVGKGRVVVLLAGWHPDDSQLGVSSKFVPLLYALLELGGNVMTASSQYFVGDEIPLALKQEGTAIAVRKPDGTTVNLDAGAERFTQATVPGTYLFMAGSRSQRVAVNVAANESRTSPLAIDELERFGAPAPASEAAVAKAVQREAVLQGSEMENRQKLWRWFIVATLVVLLIESVLAGWTTRRSAATGGLSS